MSVLTEERFDIMIKEKPQLAYTYKDIETQDFHRFFQNCYIKSQGDNME
jgi:hypothetical protein